MSSSTFLPGRTLRSHTSTSSGSGSENASQVPAALRNKLAAAQAGGNGVPAMGKRAILPAQRAALGDLGNNLRREQQQPEKQAAKKPGRALTKQKATSELSRVVLQQQQQQAKPEPRRTRSGGQRRKDSLDEKENEDENNRMDVDEVFAAVPSHDTAHAMETSALDLVDALPADVEDIDAEDAENPQMATEYVNEIYAYMRQLEREMDVRKGYMAEKKTVLKPRMRNLMVDWLVDVHVQFSLLQETLYMCVGIMDRYFQVSLDKLSTRDVQLVGITCLFIAAKYEEMYPPELGDFEYITDKAYTQKQILRMEIEIIGALGFSLSRPLPLNFLRRNSKAGMVDAETHTLAKYAMEVALVDYEMAHFHPSVAAASALALALSIHGGDASRLRGELWNANLTFYTSYSVTDLEECLQAMAKRILAINAENTAEAIKEQEASKTKKRVNRAVFKKYSNKKFSKIALHPALTDVVMEELAAGNF